ncbi:hypothetical protein EF913_25285 [Streptomyces sp. WAC04189]|nr:hypothetical protein E5N77_10685 [Streptomyces sp. SS52]RIH60001.1 hypothetical protein D3C59_21865 [Streptomyces sp. SHP22-7]RSR99262.1 hypothetical protein EF913_25285 [Streptomyces sp. WAC04189]RSS20916.1 hypothetical protein EF914_17685 [Streptomyces sp. WAC05458]RSS29524.1 hypothetical protein EF916_09495 [Streptomyces sp. WAC08452]RSS71123.1 hypothetical protein EF907_01985 [Streptomyces sp. WAC06273]RSS74287.1 hypothetical protein EF911_15910 [Streptomyces sp. WAC06128]
MPSVTVVVSSDTDIYISPGLYGDCLPTVPTDGAAYSFRAGAVSFSSARPFMLAHAPGSGQRLGDRDSRHTDTMGIVKVT